MAIMVAPGSTKRINLVLQNGGNIIADIGVDAELRVKSGATWVPFSGGWAQQQVQNNVPAGGQATFGFDVVMPFPQVDTEYAFVFTASIKPAGAGPETWALSITAATAGDSLIVDVTLIVLFVSAVWV